MKQNSKTYDIIRYIVLGAAVVVFLVAAGMLIHIFMEYKKGTDIYENISSSVLTPVDKPTGDGTDTSYIPSIDLRLPVVQGTDNEYYLNHTFNKVYNAAGALFIDSRVDKGLGGSNVIIYGHNMKNGSMFAKLAYYKNESFYRQQGNDVFYIYTGDEIREYRIFDAFENDPEGYVHTCNFGTASQLQEYASTVKSYSLYDTGVDVSSATQVVTFSTCTGDGARRIIVQGIYVGSRTDKQTSDN